MAEYLYERVAETVRKDLAEELVFVSRFDRAYEGVRGVVDMPNKKVSLFVHLALQNGGRLPKARRKHFDELGEARITAMEAAVDRAQVERDEDEDVTESSRRDVPREGGSEN